MTFDQLNNSMRQYEQYGGESIVPGMWMVVRLDGKGFTKLTKELCRLEKPFDERFQALMVATVVELMTNSGFRCLYGYTQSDEISIVFELAEATYARQPRKYLSLLSGLASAVATRNLNEITPGQYAIFDARLSLMPNIFLVRDYFRWRQADAERNALSSWCYWSLRNAGNDAVSSTQAIHGMSKAAKHELLFTKFGINFNTLPVWQRRGTGFLWQDREVAGFNPISQKTVLAKRRRVETIDMPIGDVYGDFLMTLLDLERRRVEYP